MLIPQDVELYEKGVPWMEFKLPNTLMTHLQNAIDNSSQQETANNILAGNISKSLFIKDKDDFFFNHILKGTSEHLYYQQWKNHYEVVVSGIRPAPEFKLNKLWVNYQKQYEFNPPHSHGGMFSFVVFMKIPTHWKEQHALPICSDSNTPCASNFCFLLGTRNGGVELINFSLGPEDRGKMLFFPAWLCHEVFPFYGTEEERVTISGNIILVENNPMQPDRMIEKEDREKKLEFFENQVKFYKKMIQSENND